MSHMHTPIVERGSLAEPPDLASARPQFSLKALFAVTAWAASLAALAASQLAGWTMLAIGFSLSCLNCSGQLAVCHGRTAQRRLFGTGWLLLVVSLFLPAVKGCGNTTFRGWEAAAASFELPLRLFWESKADSAKVNGFVYGFYCLLAMANLLLAGSPLFLWRLTRGKGEYYGAIFATASAAMWCFSIEPQMLLVGYYVWCLAGLAILCAYRMRWPVLPLMLLPPLLALCGR
jgi:hypothetical protein